MNNPELTEKLIQVTCNKSIEGSNGFAQVQTFYINHSGNNPDIWRKQVKELVPNVIERSITLFDLNTGEVHV